MGGRAKMACADFPEVLRLFPCWSSAGIFETANKPDTAVPSAGISHFAARPGRFTVKPFRASSDDTQHSPRPTDLGRNKLAPFWQGYIGARARRHALAQL